MASQGAVLWYLLGCCYLPSVLTKAASPLSSATSGALLRSCSCEREAKLPSGRGKTGRCRSRGAAEHWRQSERAQQLTPGQQQCRQHRVAQEAAASRPISSDRRGRRGSPRQTAKPPRQERSQSGLAGGRAAKDLDLRTSTGSETAARRQAHARWPCRAAVVLKELPSLVRALPRLSALLLPLSRLLAPPRCLQKNRPAPPSHRSIPPTRLLTAARALRCCSASTSSLLSECLLFQQAELERYLPRKTLAKARTLPPPPTPPHRQRDGTDCSRGRRGRNSATTAGRPAGPAAHQPALAAGAARAKCAEFHH